MTSPPSFSLLLPLILSLSLSLSSLPHHDQTEVYSDTDASASSDLSDIGPPIPNTRQPHYPPPSLSNQDYIHLSNLDPPQASTSRTTLNHPNPSSKSASPSILLNGHHHHHHPSGGSALIPPLIRADSNMSNQSNRSNKRGMQVNEHDEEEEEEEEEEEDWDQEERKELYGNRSGNRGNKLRRSQGVRWARRRKLGGWTEARTEKEVSRWARW